MTMPRLSPYRFQFIGTCFIFMVFVFLTITPAVAEKSRVDLQKEIKDVTNKIGLQRSKIDNLIKRIQSYQKNIAEFRNKSKTLVNELSLIELKLQENQAEIDQVQAGVETSQLEIQNITLKILDMEILVQQKKKNLSYSLKKLERLQRKNWFQIMVLNDHFSDYYNEIKTNEDIQKTIQHDFQSVKHAKERLLDEKEKLETVHQELVRLNKSLVFTQATYEDQQAYKINLMNQTQQSEFKYQDLLTQAKQEQESINTEIVALDRVARDKLKELESIGRINQTFIWPVDPDKGLSTYFHDTEYPYRYLFEHPGIDIPKPQGSIIVAPRDGYVARVRSPEDVGKGYAYIMLIHDEGFSTVFGHVSCVKVVVDKFVKQGEMIGCVGGKPGTAGAGNLTTGAHSHFEIRKDGIPVDPMKYLP